MDGPTAQKPLTLRHSAGIAVRIAGTDTLDLHHLSRAMDVLEAHKDGIAQALYVRLADLLN